MTDIDISANALVIMIVCSWIAAGFIGSAFTWGYVERRDRKRKAAASKPKHKSIDITT